MCLDHHTSLLPPPADQQLAGIITLTSFPILTSTPTSHTTRDNPPFKLPQREPISSTVSCTVATNYSRTTLLVALCVGVEGPLRKRFLALLPLLLRSPPSSTTSRITYFPIPWYRPTAAT